MCPRPLLPLTTVASAVIITILLLFPAATSQAEIRKTENLVFGPFTPSSDYQTFHVISPASINFGALQITPDTAGNISLTNNSGRVLFPRPFKLWDDDDGPDLNGKLASFNTSFLINVFRVNNATPGEGLAFMIAPSLDNPPPNSYGQFLGLTNSTTDGNPSNQFVAVELDTVKQDFDPDDNHIGLNINSVRSKVNVSLTQFGFQIAPNGTQFYVVWMEYDGARKVLDVFMAPQADKDAAIVAKPAKPVLSSDLDLKSIVKQRSYFGFSASTGTTVELNCVLRWNITVEILADKGESGREFEFEELKKATNNFDEKNKLGQGGFGVVYRGSLVKEDLEVAVKKFSRDDNMKNQDDFLAELSIINRLRHKHLVRLLGWCHKKGILLLVYEFMPNGSLDNHLFCEGPSPSPLSWDLRYNIILGVASALHYLHHEYDQKVVHRDLKASNIMLDSHFNARLGDFGLARALDNEKTSFVAELEGVPGTMGYIAPECFHTGKATRQSDVYGLGAVLLEVACGQRPWTNIQGFKFLVDWVWFLHGEGRIMEGVDRRIGDDYVVEEAERVLKLGLACSHPIASERPTMQTVIQVLSGSVPVPHVPPFKPAFVWPAALHLQSFALTATTATTSTTTSSTLDFTPLDTPSSSNLQYSPTSQINNNVE
ncbi:putative L-type lectin-domain containing receptor kinase S.5 [Senna tora]|uniref:non-specific serine/threonine protein kinase n=1 Tax=Senna tora TaxID=362788 RepID=A0A834TZE9_9FABA|nr:putative L-type lectin-domain containing receptor kinase S.5 [Senna tora]